MRAHCSVAKGVWQGSTLSSVTFWRERKREIEKGRECDFPLSPLLFHPQTLVAHTVCCFLVMRSRWSNQRNRWGPWSWYGRWEPLNDANQSWTWSSSQKGDGEWKLATWKRKLTIPELLIRIWMSSRRSASMITGISMGLETCQILGQYSHNLLYWKKNLLTDICGPGGD